MQFRYRKDSVAKDFLPLVGSEGASLGRSGLEAHVQLYLATFPVERLDR